MMTFINYIYPIPFLALGAITLVVAFSSIPICDRRALGFLAAFGFTHGANSIPTANDYGELILLPLSFFALLGFGIELLVRNSQRSKKLRWLYAFLPLLFCFWSILVKVNSPAVAWSLVIESIGPYTLGLPSCLIAAYSLWTLDKRSMNQLYQRYTILLKSSGALFFIYGLAVGIPDSQFGPNPFYLEHLVNLPPAALALIRLLAIAVLTFLLSKSFFIEISNVQGSLKILQEQISSLLAHDMKNLVNNIELSSGALIEKSTIAESSDDRQLLGILHRSAKSLNQLVSDIFDVSLIDLEKIELHRQPLDMCAVVFDACKQIEASLRGHTIQVRTPATSVWSNADQVRIDQILTNLLSNAGKYSHPGTSIIVEVKTLPGLIQISVTDEGDHLSDEQRSALFNLYYRVNETSSTVRGSGLGLNIVKGLVEAHGGHVFAESTKNGLNTFGFTLPILNIGISPTISTFPKNAHVQESHSTPH